MRARYEQVPTGPDRSFHVIERRKGRFDAPWHFHRELELTLVMDGHGRRFVGDSIQPFAAGDLVLLGPNLPHFWHAETPGAQGTWIVVQFRRDFLGDALWERPEFATVQRLLRRAERGLHFKGAVVRRAAASLSRLPQLRGCAAVLELLAVLDDLAAARQVQPLASRAYEASLDRRAEERLARVYAFLMTNFSQPLTLPEVARVAAMTPAGFSRYFKRASGRNLSDFLNEVRVDRAAALLRETSRSIAEIAHAAGFATLSNFNRRFRERLHCPPRAYRRVFVAMENVPAASRFAAR